MHLSHSDEAWRAADSGDFLHVEPHPLRFLRNLGRSGEIAAVFVKHGFGDIVDQIRMQRYVRWGRRVILRQRNLPESHETRARRFRRPSKTWVPRLSNSARS